MTEIEQTVLDAIVDRIREINADIAHYEAVNPRDPKHGHAAVALAHLRGEKSFLLTISSQLELGIQP